MRPAKDWTPASRAFGATRCDTRATRRANTSATDFACARCHSAGAREIRAHSRALEYERFRVHCERRAVGGSHRVGIGRVLASTRTAAGVGSTVDVRRRVDRRQRGGALPNRRRAADDALPDFRAGALCAQEACQSAREERPRGGWRQLRGSCHQQRLVDVDFGAHGVFDEGRSSRDHCVQPLRALRPLPTRRAELGRAKA